MRWWRMSRLKPRLQPHLRVGGLAVMLLFVLLFALHHGEVQATAPSSSCDENGSCDEGGCDENGACDDGGCDAEGCDYSCDDDEGCDYSCDENGDCDERGCDNNGCDAEDCDEDGYVRLFCSLLLSSSSSSSSLLWMAGRAVLLVRPTECAASRLFVCRLTWTD